MTEENFLPATTTVTLLMTYFVILPIGLTCLITFEGWGAKWTMGVRNFNLQGRRKNGSKQSLMYIHIFPPTVTPVFYLPVFNSVTKTIFLR